MFIFAHVFCGALIGLGFWHLTHDRRALPLCIFGAILPDLLDKPLAMLCPGFLGSGRTIGHTLLFFTIILAVGILIWRYRHTLLGVAFACAILSHQILDEMWGSFVSWEYPFLGPFPTFMIPDYAVHFFWLEISNISEWVFGCTSLVIIVFWFLDSPNRGQWCPNPRQERTARYTGAVVLMVMGVSLLLSGLFAVPAEFFAPTYNSITGTMAGMVAICGAILILPWWNHPVPGG
ncbi:MAG: metal-dependent hydrolase [Methanoregula sp.]|jgi:hypothetical protein